MTGEQLIHPSDEERIAADLARELGAMTMSIVSAFKPSEGFTDRVMKAIADEPLPQPVRAFGLALVGGHLRAAASAVGDAWRTITSAPAPMAVRAQALALVLAVLIGSLAVAAGATVGAIRVFGGTPPTPGPSVPPRSLVISSPSPSPAPDPTPSEGPVESSTPEPSDSPEPSATPDSQQTERPTLRPRTATPTATDDHGGSGSGSDSGSGSGGGGETPSPTESDDSSGSGDG
ncbi:MAG: hypothetical protein QOE42_1483 [Chloroflexota bacterium]|nr:hypothetical protein [Chloroflexota bacterium]